MNGFALNNIQNAYVGSTPAQAIYLGSTLIWPTTPPHDYSQDYLTIVSLEDNNVIGWELTGSRSRTINVSTDNGSTWTSYTSSTTGTTLATLNSGDKLLIKGNSSAYSDTSGTNNFTSTGQFNVQGNIMSLMYEDNFISQTTLLGVQRQFAYLFQDCIYLISAENLILPATTLKSWCYAAMFGGCSSLIAAPALHATTAIDCCYRSMFSGCASLTTAPELPATSVGYMAYGYMFSGCTSLNYIKCLATSISYSSNTNEYGTEEWVDGVAASGTFVKDATMTSWTTGTSGIPSGWSVIDV